MSTTISWCPDRSKLKWLKAWRRWWEINDEGYQVTVGWTWSASSRGVAHLRREPDVVVSHKARVGVVLDVLALDVMFQVEERFTWSVAHLHHTHLHDVHLGFTERGTTWELQGQCLYKDCKEEKNSSFFFFLMKYNSVFNLALGSHDI